MDNRCLKSRSCFHKSATILQTSGLQLAARLPASCYLVFTTAYARYALDGFEVDAVDFLHNLLAELI